VPRSFVEALLRGWPGEVDSELVEQARDDVRRSIAGEERAKILAEIEAASLARRALPAGGQEGEDEDERGDEPRGDVVDAEVVDENEADTEPTPGDDDSVSWDDLSESWKSRFITQPNLGLYEYEQALRREEMAHRAPRASVGRHPDFSHPAPSHRGSGPTTVLWLGRRSTGREDFGP
jgi:hypothetical protein